MAERKNMTSLKNGKWNHQIATTEEVNEAVKEIKAMITKYHWEDKAVHPYSYTMNIMELVESDGWKNFKQYTFSSKQLIISEINGLINILNRWEELELEEKITIKFIVGKNVGAVKKVAKSIANEYAELNLAEILA